jgi:predicted phosphodiesterase
MADPCLLQFQFISDIHIECYEGNIPTIIEPIAPILILAGDVGQVQQKSYSQFIEQMSLQFKHVLLVPGNHEFYQRPNKAKYTVTTALEYLEMVTKQFKNVHLLHMSSIELFGVRFVGTTLWSKVPETAKNLVQFSMNDYYLMFTEKAASASYSTKNWIKPTVEDTNSWFELQKNWLEAELSKSTLPTVVVTHHAPSPIHIDKKYDKYGEGNSAYFTDLRVMMRAPIVAWISGHSHTAKSFYLDNVLCAVNCKGYSTEKIMGFDAKRIISIYGNVAKEEIAQNCK